ncbi:MAG: hypothetical protein R3326_00570 [Gemmatimonadota bacterium]|nr:hypothetical protein [Gemmatimonadota bacterium]
MGRRPLNRFAPIVAAILVSLLADAADADAQRRPPNRQRTPARAPAPTVDHADPDVVRLAKDGDHELITITGSHLELLRSGRIERPNGRALNARVTLPGRRVPPGGLTRRVVRVQATGRTGTGNDLRLVLTTRPDRRKRTTEVRVPVRLVVLDALKIERARARSDLVAGGDPVDYVIEGRGLGQLHHPRLERRGRVIPGATVEFADRGEGRATLSIRAGSGVAPGRADVVAGTVDRPVTIGPVTVEPPVNARTRAGEDGPVGGDRTSREDTDDPSAAPRFAVVDCEYRYDSPLYEGDRIDLRVTIGNTGGAAGGWPPGEMTLLATPHFVPPSMHPDPVRVPRASLQPGETTVVDLTLVRPFEIEPDRSNAYQGSPLARAVLVEASARLEATGGIGPIDESAYGCGGLRVVRVTSDARISDVSLAPPGARVDRPLELDVTIENVGTLGIEFSSGSDVMVVAGGLVDQGWDEQFWESPDPPDDDVHPNCVRFSPFGQYSIEGTSTLADAGLVVPFRLGAGKSVRVRMELDPATVAPNVAGFCPHNNSIEPGHLTIALPTSLRGSSGEWEATPYEGDADPSNNATEWPDRKIAFE